MSIVNSVASASSVNHKAQKALTVREKFAAAHKEMTGKLVERDEEIMLSLTAIISRENVLLVGAPGTAKSLLVRALASWVSGSGKPFEYILNRFTEPDELFGPVSVVGMQRDDYRRIITNKLPEATFAFLDEFFKGSSAIINTTLSVMNEHIYYNGSETIKCPLQALFAASNEWPHEQDNGKDLGAAFDRFLFRKLVRPVGAGGRKKLLRERDHTPRFTPEQKISPAEIDQAHDEAMALPITDDTWDALDKILNEMMAAGIHPGDRRMVKSVAVVQAFAWLHGALRVEPEHLEILQHTLWSDPQEQPQKVAAIVGKHANPVGMALNQYLADAEDVKANTQADKMDEVIVASQKLQVILKKVREFKVQDERTKSVENRVKELIRETRDMAI